jgi:hypothetical protein
MWLSQVHYFYWAFVQADSIVQLSPPLRQAPKRYRAITKATLTSWTKQGLLQDHRIGGRIFYRQSEILASTKKLSKYWSIF